eukprot:CAMPEP_0180296554 /NCGR_PEP_ID=MMETSP0988-20121125/19702_1 /TAXON_ID=697907 /ORGANISM="non described non described, Strain CCMP2293" /LENGTH=39 /DNA_ID= /DNA_START= /DNA_END= /DNA_ORIENTATION=
MTCCQQSAGDPAVMRTPTSSAHSTQNTGCPASPSSTEEM